jgi:hypothetical protein
MRPWPSALGMEPESSMKEAADVVDAIAIAAGASPIFLSASSPSLPLAWAHLAVTSRSWLTSQPEPARVLVELEPSPFFQLVAQTSQPEPSPFGAS